MAGVIAFGYRPGNTPVHALDVRVKLAALALTSVSALGVRFTGLALLTVLVLAALIATRMALYQALKDLRYFGPLLLLVFVARALTTQGTAILSHGGATLTREGLLMGCLVCWRLLVVVLAGLGFTAATRASEIKAAVQWLLAPLPWVPAQRIAVMLSLMIRFVPVVLNQARETLDAQRARGIDNRRNPVLRMIKLAVPVLRRTFDRAHKLAEAMEARCYTEERTDPHLAMCRNDWIALASIGLICTAALLG